MSSNTKRTIKFLAICSDTKTAKQVIKSSNNSVLKSIANAALNAAAGDVSITHLESKLFQDHRSTFDFLIEKHSILAIKHYLTSNKNKVLILLPTLLSCVIKSIGTSFITKDVRLQKICPYQPQRIGSNEREEHQRIQSECDGTSEN